MHQFILTPAIRRAWCDRDVPPEQPLIEWARQLQAPDTIALDIGAHVGDWAVDMAGHSREVHAFEAQGETFELLRANCIRYSNVKLHHVALGAGSGTTDLHIIPDDGGKSSIDFTPIHREFADLRVISDDGGGSSIEASPMHRAARIERVPLEPLDAYNLTDVGLIKIDVEGAELVVIRGAIETLRRSRWPKILFEAWSYDWFAQKREELFGYLNSIGYRITPINWPDMFLAER
jgi:FkbM family methyltransferase